jgi:hypothetical protein
MPRGAKNTPDRRARHRRGLVLSPAADLSQTDLQTCPYWIFRLRDWCTGCFFAGLRRGSPPAPIGTKTSPGTTPEVKAGQRHQGRETGNVRAGSLASPVEWVIGLSLEFLNSVKPQPQSQSHSGADLGHGVTPGCRLAQADSCSIFLCSPPRVRGLEVAKRAGGGGS